MKLNDLLLSSCFDAEDNKYQYYYRYSKIITTRKVFMHKYSYIWIIRAHEIHNGYVTLDSWKLFGK